jgi:hypothetical protein
MMEMNDFERLKVVLDPFLNIFILKHREKEEEEEDLFYINWLYFNTNNN